MCRKNIMQHHYTIFKCIKCYQIQIMYTTYTFAIKISPFISRFTLERSIVHKDHIMNMDALKVRNVFIMKYVVLL